MDQLMEVRLPNNMMYVIEYSKYGLWVELWASSDVKLHQLHIEIKNGKLTTSTI